MSTGHSGALNLEAYRSEEVVAHYSTLAYITPCEQSLFERYVPSDASVLDLGVGGGRTTAYLAARASHYIGLDYSEAMILTCRRKFPRLKFMQRDAADLSCFEEASFSVAVMAFNGLDYLSPSSRKQCLHEVCRVLEPGGVFVFSSHNPHAIFVRPSWNRERVRRLAEKWAPNRMTVREGLSALLTVMAVARAFIRAAGSTLVRIGQRTRTTAFWRGDGYVFDPVHGGLLTHCARPSEVKKELESAGFEFREVLASDFPRPARAFSTDWYYYAFSKPPSVTGGPACAS